MNVKEMQAAAAAGFPVHVVVNGEFYDFSGVSADDNKESARILCDAIKEFSKNPDALENFENYLSNHFGVWLVQFASTPARIADEFKRFSEMEV